MKMNFLHLQICNMMNVASDDFFTFQVRKRSPSVKVNV